MDPTPSLLQKVDPDRIPRVTLANLYPKQVWYFLATFIVLVSACHAVSTLYAYLTCKRGPPILDAPLRHGVSLNRLPLAILNLFRTITFRWSIVIAGSYTLNVADFLLAGMYCAVVFTWTFINSKNTLGMKYDPKYWANRCAHIAGSQLPLMTALGMKNNFLSFLTGVSFDKARDLALRFHLHRVVARVICVMLWVHAFGRVSSEAFSLPPSSSSDIEPTAYWFRIGVTGASALTILCFLSIRPLRSRNYELFLYIHLTLGVITLAGAYIHAGEFGQVYIWPALFLWGLDRFLRLVRISLVNSQLFKASNPHVASDATVTVLSPHFLRILVDSPAYFLWRPGQSAYLTISGVDPTSLTEAHPFTIANGPQHDLDASASKDEGASEKGSSNEETTDASRERGSGRDKPATPSRQLMFILRVREGFTRRLADSVLANPNSNGVSKSCKAFIDGPYSSPPIVRGFETVVFICGGSGISFALPLFLDLLYAVRVRANPCCQRVVLVWAIRDPDQINWIAQVVTRALSSIASTENAPVIDVRLHVTTAAEDAQSLEGRSSVSTDAEATAGTIDPTAKERLFALQGVSLIYGRPEIKGILDRVIAEARGAVSINVCGTTELAQSVRYALRGGITRFMDVLRGGPSVLLHVEGFGNA
ncbi:ferric reductase NAD binding domain-containing protein [Mycena galopus ATCC 62051]|nr:ferric reductase NAD binding domain-containing protein [Mycena galopus ATCC 62051]